jgi:hypothetical protein
LVNFLVATPQRGDYLELAEHYPFDAVSALYGAVSKAAKDWDGSDPFADHSCEK